MTSTKSPFFSPIFIYLCCAISLWAYLVITLKVKINNQITKNKPGPKVFDYIHPKWVQVPCVEPASRSKKIDLPYYILPGISFSKDVVVVAHTVLRREPHLGYTFFSVLDTSSTDHAGILYFTIFGRKQKCRS